MSKPGVKKGNTPWNKGNGEGWINGKGYMCIKIDGKERKVHRLIMEGKLGRKLLASEDVHHIDGDRLNNLPSNLTLLPHGDHSVITNKNRIYKKGYKLSLKPEEIERRRQHLKNVRINPKGAIKKQQSK